MDDSHYSESPDEAYARIHRGEKEYTQEQEDADMEKYYEKKEVIKEED